MAITKGHRFEIDFDRAFPLGLVMVGDVAPDIEYQSREGQGVGSAYSSASRRSDR